MTNKLIYPIVVVVFAAACGGDGEDGKAVAGQQYETVQEGSAAGVTSSIAGPGETLPPITNTNADTTSAFALNPNAVPMAPQSGAVAGTMPPPSQPVYSGTGGGVSPAPRPSSPTTQRQAYVPPPMTSSTRPAPQQPPAPAENAAPAPQQPAEEPAEEPAPSTDTSATTNTAPPPPTNTAPPPSERPKPQEEPQEEEAEEPAEEPPPPPPFR